MGQEVKGLGRSMFAAVLLVIGGVLNIIYGIAAIGNSSFFTANAHYVFSDLKTWGWVTLILGILEVLAAIAALLDIPARPFWSLAVFALSLWIIRGLWLYGESTREERYQRPPSPQA